MNFIIIYKIFKVLRYFVLNDNKGTFNIFNTVFQVFI
jgi:hypothetical protein